MNAINQLIHISSNAISNRKILSESKEINKLSEILSLKNGFQAFGRAFRMLSADQNEQRNILSWNRFIQNILNDDRFFFFADSVLGDGFCFFENKIFKYDFESGDLELMGESLLDFSRELIKEYNYYTGYSLLKEWEKANNITLSFNQVLMPIMPFSLGGEFDISNLYQSDISIGITEKINLNNQIKTLNDGDVVKINLVP